jgi:signal transduction histidine kinase
MVARRSHTDFNEPLGDPESSSTSTSLDESDLRPALEARTREVEALRRRLAELDATGGKFLSAAAHELKTPLTVIQSYLEIMLSDLTEGLTSEQHSFLQIVYDSVLRLRTLILDLIDVAALETGSLQLDLIPVDAAGLIQEACEEMRTEAERGGLELKADVSPDLPPIHVDAPRLKDVLRRLLDNAVKFTPAGGSIVVRAAGGSNEVVLQIEDTGVGIPNDRLKGIFEEFVQVHRKPGERRQGSGLGLAICRRLIHSFGGSIEVESSHGEGTTMTIRLPAPLDSD